MNEKGAKRNRYRNRIGKEIAEKFLYIKEKLGFKTDEDVLIYLINESYERLFSKG